MMGPFAVAMIVIGLGTGDIPDTAVVARVGQTTITVRNLLDSYEFGPAFVKRSRDPLRRHLQYMINECLIAEEGKHLRLDTTLFVRERVAALEEDLAVDGLYRHQILSTVTLSPGEIDTAVQKARINIRLRWLFAPTLAAAHAIRNDLGRGVPFDSLFRRTLDTTDSPGRRTLETTMLKLERDNPELASKIAGLTNRQVSPLVEGPDGYYFFRIDELWRKPLLTETELRKLTEDAQTIVRIMKADAHAEEYVKSRMKVANPVIKAEGFNIARAYIAQKGLSHETQLAWSIPSTFMTEAGPLPIAESAKLLSRALVTFGNGMLTVRDYLRWFDIRQFQLKTRTLAAFNRSVKLSIWKMVQDRILSREAYAGGFNRETSAVLETNAWRTKLLYLAARSAFDRGIGIDDSLLWQEYKRQKRTLRESKGHQQSFESVRSALWSDLYYRTEQQVLFRALQRLKRELPVYVNEDLVRALGRGVRRDPSALDIIVYKPGGTFPRLAYPSIDPRWQSFP
jgi:hypothetical protein